MDRVKPADKGVDTVANLLELGFVAGDGDGLRRKHNEKEQRSRFQESHNGLSIYGCGADRPDSLTPMRGAKRCFMISSSQARHTLRGPLPLSDRRRAPH